MKTESDYPLSCFDRYLQRIRLCMILPILFLAFSAEAGRYSRETPVVEAVRKVSPAVVNVSSEYPVQRQAHPFFGMDPFFDSFFKDFYENAPKQEYKRSSLGSGVIIDGNRGFILTNAHVIAKAGKITVVLNDERELEASVVGADNDSDLAVLRIGTEQHLPSVEMGNSDDLMIGEEVIAIGNPFGFSHTVTTGVISALHRSIRAEEAIYQDFIQTDASINPGNSGGPLLNINGELIGINTAIYAKAQGIGFAIPINKAKRVIRELIQYGQVSESWIGLSVQEPDPNLARYLNLKGKAGVLVRSVEPDSPAHKAGIKEGDVIVSIGNQAIAYSEDYYALMKGIGPGETLTVNLLREGSPLKVTFAAGTFPVHRAAEVAYARLGVKVADIQNKSGGKRSAEGVVITQVRPRSYLEEIGVKPGDVIRRIDEMPVSDTRDFEKAIVRYRNKNSVVILLFRGDQGYYVTVRL